MYRKIDLLFYLGGRTYRQTAVTTGIYHGEYKYRIYKYSLYATREETLKY